MVPPERWQAIVEGLGEALRAGQFEQGLASAIGEVDGWHLVSTRLLRRRTVRDVAGPWAAAIDFRARLLAA